MDLNVRQQRNKRLHKWLRCTCEDEYVGLQEKIEMGMVRDILSISPITEKKKEKKERCLTWFRNHVWKAKNSPYTT